MNEPVMIWKLKRGDLFRVGGATNIFRFDHMDGMYCFARDVETDEIFNWCGPVELVTE